MIDANVQNINKTEERDNLIDFRLPPNESKRQIFLIYGVKLIIQQNASGFTDKVKMRTVVL